MHRVQTRYFEAQDVRLWSACIRVAQFSKKSSYIEVKLEYLEGVSVALHYVYEYQNSSWGSGIFIKIQKIVRARGPWFESGQRTFVKLVRFTIKFRFSVIFGSFWQSEITYGSNSFRKTKFYGEFIKFHKCPLTRFEPQTPSTHNFLNFDEIL